MLHRAVKFLRVVQNKSGVWDALDQPEDTPAPEETVFAYQITEKPGMCHIRSGKRGASGFYAIATYRMCAEQPYDQVMRGMSLWQQWCAHQPDPCAGWQ
jgi:hypothetical protein